MDVEIRDADFSDAVHCTGIADVIDSYAREPAGGGHALSADVRARLIPGLESHPTSLVLLALADRRPIGVAVCFFGFSTFHARPLLNIHDLAVVPEWRGRGVGRALLEAAEERAVRRGCCKLTLEVRDDNHGARALYERCGFTDFMLEEPTPTRFLSKPL
jgi:ribosomal protein S18 acetylase RimI-like enzyme